MKTQKIRGKRRVNYKNCYLLFISVLAVFSLMGNFFQDTFYNKAIAIQQQTIETMQIDSEEYPIVEDSQQQLSANNKD